MGLSTSKDKTATALLTNIIQANEAVKTLRGFFRGVPKGGKTTKDRPIIWLDALRALDKIEDIITKETERVVAL